MQQIIKELNLNMEAQVAGFRQRWDVTQVRIITLMVRILVGCRAS